MQRRALSAISPVAGNAFDVAIVGGGHNALVSANYLARAGQKVVVVERRDVLGGAAITEELHPGFQYSRASYVYSLFRPHIAADLDLASKGLRLMRRLPSSFTPGRGAGSPSLTLGGGEAFDAANIAQFSQKDADAYARYNEVVERYARFARYLLDVAPPDVRALLSGAPFADHDASASSAAAPFRQRLDALETAVRLGVRALQDLGPRVPDFLSFLTSPAAKTLNRFFESEVLKATLATDAVIGAFAGPHTPGTGYVLMHHSLSPWFTVESGMGTVSKALATVAKENGVEFITGKSVKRICVKDANGSEAGAEVEGLELSDGSVIKAKAVFSSVAPTTTFVSAPLEQAPLLPEASEILPQEVYRALQSSDHRSAVMKINCAIDRLPQFVCKLPGKDATMLSLLEQHRRSIKPIYGEVSPTAALANSADHLHLRGTVHFEHSVAELDKSYRDACGGSVGPNYRPLVEMTIPSLLDASIVAPAEREKGRHVCLLFVQYAPYQHANSWTSPSPRAAREAFADRVFSVIDEHAPGFSSSVLHRDILAPPDLEGIFGLPGGNIFHSAMGLDQLFWSRPVSTGGSGGGGRGGLGSYRVPWVKGLYLNGAGTHPGGGVMGAAGHNAVMQFLKNEKGWTRNKLRTITSSPWITSE